jgi:hypothetical protein
MSNSGPTNRIEPTPVRISTNFTVGRQTEKRDFGDQLLAGVQNVGGAIASGAAMAAPLVGGGAIVSAAVSTVSNIAGALGTSSGAATAGAYTSGLVGLGGGTGINTTVGGGAPVPGGNTGIGGGVAGGGLGGMAVGGGGGLGGGGVPGVGGGGGGLTNDIAGLQSMIAQNAQQNAQLLGVQQQMQRENVMFTTVSNVLKTRHDTVKNSISNVR